MSGTAGTNTLVPRHGVVTLYGYGIDVRVDRGHLLFEDGIGEDRRRVRLPRVAHGLKRLVIIGADGLISLAALRWLADQDAAFVMLDRDGSVLATTGPIRSSDVKLRRAQALALQSGVGLRSSRELIDRKLAGQEKVAQESLRDNTAAIAIKQFRSELAEAESIDTVRFIESQAARVYWTAWRTVPVTFPRKDLPRVPEHWLSFGSRISPLTGSPRLAANPVNAILNYLYALLEAEARLAAATLGLDPGIGVLHVDTSYRDSLACDLMEPIRPDVDAFVLDWIRREPLPRNWFFEQRNGNCRLMAPLATRLSQTAPTWARLVAPVAERFARELCSERRTTKQDSPATRLTQRNKREAKGTQPMPRKKWALRPQRICRGCGKEIGEGRIHCSACAMATATLHLTDAARIGRVAAHAPEAQAKRAATQRVNTKARWQWKDSDQASWLTEKFYWEEIQPKLAVMSSSVLARSIGVSRCYAGDIRRGRLPHPRHWLRIANLVGITEPISKFRNPETSVRG